MLCPNFQTSNNYTVIFTMSSATYNVITRHSHSFILTIWKFSACMTVTEHFWNHESSTTLVSHVYSKIQYMITYSFFYYGRTRYWQLDHIIVHDSTLWWTLNTIIHINSYTQTSLTNTLLSSSILSPNTPFHTFIITIVYLSFTCQQMYDPEQPYVQKRNRRKSSTAQ